MANTLQDLKTRLRFRLGETTNGLWDDAADYEGLQSAAPIDELKMILNEAQVSAMRDVFTHQWMPFRRLSDTLNIIPNQTIFTLPVEYIQMVDVYHHKENQEPLRLKPRILSGYRQIDPNYVGAVESFFQFYEISGQIGVVLAEGTITWTDNLQQFAADQVNLSTTRVGDIVTNLTDQSQGVISGFQSGIAEIEDGFRGGRANRIETGDEFMIHSREETRFVLETWPPIDIPSPVMEMTFLNADDGTLRFQSDDDATVASLDIRLPQSLFLAGGTLENYEPFQNIIVYIVNTDSNEIVDILGFQNAQIGINTLEIVESQINKGQGLLQFYAGANYQFYILLESDLDTIIEVDWIASDLKLYQPPTDYLSINFVKRPAPFLINESFCEIPEELQELVIEKAALTALRKKMPELVNPSLLQYYKILVEDSKEYLVNLQPPHAQDIESEDFGRTTHTPGFVETYL